MTEQMQEIIARTDHLTDEEILELIAALATKYQFRHTPPDHNS